MPQIDAEVLESVPKKVMPKKITGASADRALSVPYSRLNTLDTFTSNRSQ
jgi:hypothetical protein